LSNCVPQKPLTSFLHLHTLEHYQLAACRSLQAITGQYSAASGMVAGYFAS